MRGYRKLAKSEDPFIINRIQEELTIFNLKINSSHASTYIYGEETKIIEIATRQFLLRICAGLRLNKAILLAMGQKKGKSCSPMPIAWINKLREQGIPISRVSSTILFGLLLILLLLVGLARAGRAIFYNKKTDDSLDTHVQFVDIARNNLPRKKTDQSYDIVSWYMQWEMMPSDIKEIRHTAIDYENRSIRGVRLVSSKNYLPTISGLMKKIYFCVWVSVSFLISAFSLLTGRWVNALLYPEAISRKIIELAESNKLAADYLFSISSAIYRPLWTYAAERKGSQITLYNYAASFSQFKMKDRYPFHELGYQSVSWPRMLYWSESYANYTRAIISPEVDIKIVPPIWFTDSDDEFYTNDKPCIAIFDVTPVRNSFSNILMPTPVYRTYQIGKSFLEEIYTLANEHGYDLLWKRKRTFGTVHNRAYIKFAEYFGRLPGVIVVSSEISPFRVVQECVATISMPFTSTALISRNCNIMSIYYDPSEILFKDDRGCQGIPIISGIGELSTWFNDLNVHNKNNPIPER